MKAAPLTLEALNKKIKSLVKEGLDSHWVIAEISELKVNYSGHCYLELIQKSEKTDAIIARSRAIIWANTFRMLQPYFESTTGHDFTEGIQVMLRVVVEFHEVYGLSLNVVDIEPTYTVGELQVRKQKILEKLAEQGVIDMNRELDLPYLINRIAIISSKTAAGLGDFNDQLENNPHGFKFYTRLFPAIMQGNEAEGSIINQLDKIADHTDIFDAVIIIRGGGASADLECFNSFWLANNVAQFPIPVFTGIGHEQDDTVVDIVANTRLKTPTAVAEFLVDRMTAVYDELLTTEQTIVDYLQDEISLQKNKLSAAAFSLFKLYNSRLTAETNSLKRLVYNFSSATKQRLTQQRKSLDRSPDKIQSLVLASVSEKKYVLNHQKQTLKNNLKLSLMKVSHKLKQADETIKHTNPANVLRMGYSITKKDGKSVRDTKQLKKGDLIETTLYKGKTSSVVK